MVGKAVSASDPWTCSWVVRTVEMWSNSRSQGENLQAIWGNEQLRQRVWNLGVQAVHGSLDRLPRDAEGSAR